MLDLEPGNYTLVQTAQGPAVLAHGRDPYFPGWPDTLQLDYANPATRDAMQTELLAAAALCDGLRCDVAMLVLPDVFQQTWGVTNKPFWPGAIASVRQHNSGFVFIAEVYWGLEAVLLQQGFDLAYDKTLYDLAVSRNGRGVRDHLGAALDHQRHLVRFLENHDEPRAAAAFPWDVHQAAAVLTYLTPGLRFFHEGQAEGRRIRAYYPLEPCCGRGCRRRRQRFLPAPAGLAATTRRFGTASGACWNRAKPGRATRRGTALSALPENREGERLLGVVNFQPTQGQCYVRLPFSDLAGGLHDLRDVLGPSRYARGGDDMLGRGLYLDLPAWEFHLFSIEMADRPNAAL